MTSVMAPICWGCKHREAGLVCNAYPEGIPEDIVMSRADHRQPFPGDGGVRFDPKDDDAAAYAEELFDAVPSQAGRPLPGE